MRTLVLRQMLVGLWMGIGSRGKNGHLPSGRQNSRNSFGEKTYRFGVVSYFCHFLTLRRTPPFKKDIVAVC